MERKLKINDQFHGISTLNAAQLQNIMFSSSAGIVLSWNMELRPFHASVATYQIFAYQGRLNSLPA